jgi:hypothetical protein
MHRIRVDGLQDWDMALRVEQVAKAGGYSEEVVLEVLSGLLGSEIAHAYTRHTIAIQPLDLINDGVAAHLDLLKEMERQDKWFLAWGLIGFVAKNLDDARCATAVLDLLEFFHSHTAADRDLAIAVVSELMRSSTQNVEGFSEAVRIIVLRNPSLIEKIGKSNEKRQGDKTMIDLLSSRPELAKAIANSVSIGEPITKVKVTC